MSPSVPSPKQLGGEAISPDLVGGLDDIIQGFGKLGPELINGHVTQKEVFLNGGETRSPHGSRYGLKLAVLFLFGSRK